MVLVSVSGVGFHGFRDFEVLVLVLVWGVGLHVFGDFIFLWIPGFRGVWCRVQGVGGGG